MIVWLLKAGRPRILASTAVLAAIVSLADWFVGHNVSLAALYILPMMLGAVVLGPWESAALSLLFSYIRAVFDVAGEPDDNILRFLFAALAYFLSALFVNALVRKHLQAVEHLSRIEYETSLRKDAEQQLQVLVESSPAAVLTTDGSGVVLDANSAASSLFAIPEGETLLSRSIVKYLPMLADALGVDADRRLRTAAQCQGVRDNGEIFLANLWFSSYPVPDGKRLAAIIVDSSEELRDREEHGLRQLMRGNRIAAAAVAHEVRNVCSAMTVLCSNLRKRYDLASDDDWQGLVKLASGLESIASFELKSSAAEVLEKVPLRVLLDDLRIVVEPAWKEIDGTLRWNVPADAPCVIAEPHGLLQAFLNLAQNSLRAVQQGEARRLQIDVCPEGNKVTVRFRDSGPGVQAPERLFVPFQEGAAGSGMGLYMARFIVRSYGGELRFEPQPYGSCFAVELLAAVEAVR
jgi:two-component system, LuxR family, sensor kinase FixL